MSARTGFRIATIRGIPIRLHVTFLIALPLLAYAFGRELSSAARLAGVPSERLAGGPWAWGLALVVALFASVLLHELAHSLYAVRVGGRVGGITLLPIGGVSEFTGAPDTPRKETLVALAGPATSFVLAGAFRVLHAATLALGSFELSFALYHLALLNLSLGLFNLLPAFPMDGGRVVRGLLAARMGMARATRVAAGLGKLFAAAFAIAGFLLPNLILMIIGFFVFVGAEGEERLVLAKAMLGDLRVREVMTPLDEAVSASETLYDVGERMVQERRVAFPVTDDGRVLGVLTLEALEHVPVEARRAARAGEIVRASPAIGPDDRVVDTLGVFDERRVSQLAVVDGDRVIGLLSPVDIVRGLRLRELERSQHPGAG